MILSNFVYMFLSQLDLNKCWGGGRGGGVGARPGGKGGDGGGVGALPGGVGGGDGGGVGALPGGKGGGEGGGRGALPAGPGRWRVFDCSAWNAQATHPSVTWQRSQHSG